MLILKLEISLGKLRIEIEELQYLVLVLGIVDVELMLHVNNQTVV